MARLYHQELVLAATLFLVLAGFLPAKADVRAVNQCPYDLTVFYLYQNHSATQLDVPSMTKLQLNLPTPWVGGVIWASQHANPDNGEATQLEMNIGPNRDYYDVSVVNAYNLPVMINVTYLAGGDEKGGLECGSPICVIDDMNTVCQLDNYFTGPDPCCINADGPGTIDTPSIQLFYDQCPSAYVQSNNGANVVYACNTGSQYDAIWCP